MADEDDPYYLAIDPGLHTGWAIWNEQGKFLAMGTTHTHADFHSKLESLPSTIKVVIVEEFTLWAHKAKAQAGSKMPASKTIGQVETFARLWRAKIIKQDSSIKPIAENMTGQRTVDPVTKRPLMPKIHTHVIDAFNHGEYWLIKNKIKQIDLRL